MRSINESQSRPKSGISLIEAFMFLSICGVITGGAAFYYASKTDELLAVGTTRLVTTLSRSPMNEVCPGQSADMGLNCRVFGDYRVHQTHGDSWTIARLSTDQEIAMVAGGKLYVTGTVGSRQSRSAQFEAIKGVVGKPASAIAAEKS
jgi:hypothetical protein